MTPRTRVLVLACAFGVLLVVYLVPQFLAGIPREPRLIFENQGSADIDRLIVKTLSKKIDVGRVRAGRTVVLPVKPDSGDVYLIEGNEFSGSELLHYFEFARQARTDVRLGIDEHGCGWIEDDGPFHHDGSPSKRIVIPPYPVPGASY